MPQYFIYAANMADAGTSYDPITKIISTAAVKLNLCPKGVGWYILDCMKQYPSNLAQIVATTGEQDLYSSLIQRCIRTAIELKNRGIKPGDVISVCSENHLNTVVPFIASFLVGALMAPLAETLFANDAKHLLNLSKPKIVFASQAGVKLLEKSTDTELITDMKIITFEESDKYENFDIFIQPKIDEDNFNVYIPENLEETALLLCTSGTSGLPKLISLSHGFVISLIFHYDPDVYLIYSPLYWASAALGCLGITVKGGTKLICSHFDETLIWEYLEKYKVTVLVLISVEAIQTVRVKPADAVCKLRLFITMGESVFPKNIKMIQEAMPKTFVAITYGQTEVGVLANSFTPVMKDHLDSVGIPVNGRTYKIVDPDTEEVLGLNQQGELRIKTKWCMSGYYKMDSSNLWDADGFLKTGDVAYFDDDLFMYVVDRVKEMFKCKKRQITPVKLEVIMDTHPDVVKSTIIGIPHEEDMNRPMAFVIVKEGSELTPAELETYFNERVEETEKITAGIRFINELPLTPSGKVKRIQLKQMVLNNLI